MAEQKKLVTDLTSGNTSRQLIKFATPFILGTLLQTLYNVVDMIVVGQYVGSAAMTAVSIGGQLLVFFTQLCVGFCTGGQIVIAQYVGARDSDRLKRIIGTMFTTVISLSILLMIVEIIFKRTFLNWLNTPPECFDAAVDYTIVCAFGMPFIYGYNCVCAVLRGMGDSKRPFVFIVIATVTNVVLDVVFIVFLNMSTLGAALATVIGQAVSFVCSIVYLVKRRESFGFDFKPKSFAVDKKELSTLVKVGAPLSLRANAIIISIMFVNSFINAYGVYAAAASGVGTKVSNITHIISQSLNMACSAMIGQNFGAGKFDRVTDTAKAAIKINLVIFVITGSLMLLFPRQIFSLFNSDEEVLKYAWTYMLCAVIGDLAGAIMTPINAIIEGSGHTTYSLFVAIMDGVVTRIGISLLFGITFGMELTGFFLGNSIARYTTLILGGVFVLSGRWRKQGAIKTSRNA